MFGLGLPEILLIGVILFLLFGAKKLPELGQGLGKTIRELNKIRDERKTAVQKGQGKEAQKGKDDQPVDLIADLKKEVEEIPGLKEAKEIKKTIGKIKNLKNFLK